MDRPVKKFTIKVGNDQGTSPGSVLSDYIGRIDLASSSVDCFRIHDK